jgi:ATP-binding cassette subfamily C protein/ATP-binding cassette subfamily C protein LapB
MTTLSRGAAARTLTDLLRLAGPGYGRVRLGEAMPHVREELTADDLVATLRNLGVAVICVDRVRPREIAAQDCPCLMVGADGQVTTVLDARGGQLLVRRGDAEPRWASPGPGRVRLVAIDEMAAVDAGQGGLATFLRALRPQMALLAAVSLVTALLGLAAPVLIMVLYDQVIPTDATDLLRALIVAMAGLLAIDFAIRVVRGRALAWVGAGIEARLGLALVAKLAALPIGRVQGTGVQRQIARLRQFEGLRGIFTGPVATTLLDAPYAILFFAVIWALSPAIGLLVLALAAAFAVAAWLTLPVETRLNARAAADRAELNARMIEAARHQWSIQRLGLGGVWTRRCEAAADVAAASARAARQFHLGCQAVGQTLMMAAGIGAVVLGTRAALDGGLTFGGLIALITLVWKVLAPVQALFSSGAQIAGFVRTARQVEATLALEEEPRRGLGRQDRREFRAEVRLEGAALRYPGTADAAIAGVSATFRPGELVMVCGRNGSGRSSLLRLVGGLHRPSAGKLFLDGIDYRQLAVDDLRGAVAHVPQVADFFHGTVLQNFRLADPSAREDEIWAALVAVGVEREVQALPDGIETRLSEEARRTLARGTLQALSIARGVLRRTSIHLFDEPCAGLDPRHEEAFLAWLTARKGEGTVVMVTDRPSHLQLADRLVYLEGGRVIVNDTGPDALRRVRGLLASMRKGQP